MSRRKAILCIDEEVLRELIGLPNTASIVDVAPNAVTIWNPDIVLLSIEDETLAEVPDNERLPKVNAEFTHPKTFVKYVYVDT